MMFNIIFYFISALLIISKSDSSCNGCSAGASCDVEFVPNQVYGCGGIWGSGNDRGVSNGEWLCGDGYSICESPDQASSLGLTLESCTSTSIATDYYYVTLAGADDLSNEYTCTDYGTNNLFGCGNPNSGDWMIFSPDQPVNCGPLGAVVTTTSAGDHNGWAAGWEVWGSTQPLGEVTGTWHNYPQVQINGQWEYQSVAKGGVLCCAGTKSPTIATTGTPSMSPTAAPDFTLAQKQRIAEWKSRAVYQIITDRFARTDGDDSDCTDLSGYCGGTFIGIKNKLDYIQGLGYDAIWISPVVENTADGYHGYWAKDIYEINPYFGTESDLIALVDELHERDMYLMMDIVINHMGRRNTSAAQNFSYDYSGFTPFDSSEYYHDSCNNPLCDQYCSIDTFDYYSESGLERIKKCRLAGLPDLNSSNPDVMEIFCDWVSEYVEDKWMSDAIRLDTVPEVDIEYWGYFLSNSCISDSTFNVGEYFWGDPAILGAYQPTMDSVFGYPMYYTLENVFGRKSEGLWSISGRLWDYSQNFIDYSALGLFTDNHDNKRWLCSYPDMTNYKNALLFMHTAPGIPYGYYGTEQGFDGCDDPENREPLWTSKYDTESELYVYIQTINLFRKGFEIYNGNFKELWSSADLYAYSRGDNTLIILTNNGKSFNETINTWTLKTGLYCNVFTVESDCFEKTVDEVFIDIDKGVGKFYVAVDDIPIETTQFYFSSTMGAENTDSSDSGEIIVTDKRPTDPKSTKDTEKPGDTDGTDRNYGVYVVFMAVLMTIYN